MDPQHHVYLITMLQEVFGSKLCNNCAVEGITLDYLWEKKYQVRSECCFQLFPSEFVLIGDNKKIILCI